MIGKDGSEQTVTSWMAQGDNNGEAASMQGGAALQSEEISRYEVRTTEGERLVTLKPGTGS